MRNVRIVCGDFPATGRESYDYIISNPPYVAITGISETEKVCYRRHFVAAHGRFDLYLLFFEQALKHLRSGGRLVFITPEKFLYVETAGPLREMLAQRHVEEIRLVREDTFVSGSVAVSPPERTRSSSAQPPSWTPDCVHSRTLQSRDAN